MRRVLVIGSGGREHAIVWKLSGSPLLEKLFCAPGNPGTAALATNLDADIKNFSSIASAVKENKIDMVVVGPEDPLVNGLRDFFEADSELANVVFIGPGREGAKLEGSKEYAKAFMERWNIPTARYMSFGKEDIGSAYDFLDTLQAPYVLKADGLAGGKGVVIPTELEEARLELATMLDGKFGDAGKRVVIEEYLNGIELSVFVLTDGKDYLILPEAKDYKRIGEGDTGLNTGGMGAVSPVLFADAAFMKKVEDRIVKPTVDGLRSDNIPYKGFIFIGLMNCGGEPFVIEYNVRMGDPETEAVMPRIESDLLAHFVALGEGRLGSEKVIHSSKSALTIVAVSGGYPEQFQKGYPVEIASDVEENTLLFHSGTRKENGVVVSSGGRVMAVTALADNLSAARDKAYRGVSHINFKDIYFRRDLGLDLLNFKTN